MIGNLEVLTCERAMYDNLWQEGQKLSQMAVGYNKKNSRVSRHGYFLVVKCIQGCDYLLTHKGKSSFLIMQIFMQKTIFDFPCFVCPIRLVTSDKVGHLGESWREL